MKYTHNEAYEATLKYFSGDELAANVFITKYCLRNKDGEFLEKTPDDMHERMASEFARIEEKFHKDGSSSSMSKKKILSYLKNFKYIVPQGSPMMGIGNNHVNVSLSNCVVIEPPADSVSSIMDAGKHLANLFKRRCGVGIDLSHLRPEGAPVNNSARTTTGAWSFADFYSYVCRMIGQNGRRGALMITMDIRHPDIESFITMKRDLTKVTGANVSVKISDDFMRAVENKETFTLQFPIDTEEPTATKEVLAEDVWNMIIESATATAEPGILMWDNIVNNLPAHSYSESGFKTVCTNPCGEIPLSAYDSCRLISINLKNMVKNPFSDKSKFDFKKLREVVTVGMRLSDDLVELELEKLESIHQCTDTEDEKEMWSKLLKAARDGRRTGMGTHGLADAIARLGLKYDSAAAIAVIEKIYETLRNSAYSESISLARDRGSFPVFDWELEKENRFISRLPEELQNSLSTHGRRNISILTNAPTGSVSILSQTSSGLEPVFRNWYIRRRKLSHDEQDVVPDFVDEMDDKWAEYRIFHHNVQEYLELFGTDKIPEFFVESDQIDGMQRIAIQEAIQKSIDHSISSTINLPKETNPETVGALYLEGWRRGLKGITVYVEGSRTGVLISNSENKKEEFPQHTAPKRPFELPCDIHHTTIQGEKWVIMVGLMDGRPYEVMGGLSNLIEIPRSKAEGVLMKHPRKTMNSVYDLQIGTNGETVIIKDLVKAFDNPNHSAFTRVISLGLRHGANIQYVVEQLQKDRDSDMFSFARCVARVLKSYIPDGQAATEKTCPECGTEGLVYVEGCVTCRNCGFSKCG